MSGSTCLMNSVSPSLSLVAHAVAVTVLEQTGLVTVVLLRPGAELEVRELVSRKMKRIIVNKLYLSVLVFCFKFQAKDGTTRKRTADEVFGYDQALKGMKYPTTIDNILDRERVKMQVALRQPCCFNIFC